jgi:hypothetical protein
MVPVRTDVSQKLQSPWFTARKYLMMDGEESLLQWYFLCCDILKMEVIGSSEMSVLTRTTWHHHTPEDSILHKTSDL